MAQLRYAWAEDFTHKNIDPQKVGEWLESLHEMYKGLVTKEQIVAAARRPHSPIHKLIEWDENVAAERYRRQQVSKILGAVRVKKDKKPTTRAFVYVSHPEHKGRKVFIDIASASANPEMRHELAEQATIRLRQMTTTWLNRYGSVRETRVLKQLVERMQRKVEAELLAAGKA